jgi:ATP-dependent DNA helicase RecQ
LLALKKFFHHSAFRSYEGDPLQQNAIESALRHESLLAIFPTGGGKSITFQLPALMAAENGRELTVVISPLQSLMKDQVDNLEKNGILNAVTINGLLDPIERQKSLERVEDGSACLLYIAPESLRSVTIERLLLKRKISRFVIDEAHCLSSWGQDFRVDYLYIGEFIRNLQTKKKLDLSIPVSCFTATAKQQVVEDIKQYFEGVLRLNLRVFRTGARRRNLRYQVSEKLNDNEKYSELRIIVERTQAPTIVYVSRTKFATKLTERLQKDGFSALCFHGRMESKEKMSNQDAFMNGNANIMVATSAFGMGVDKDNVEVVVHYDISDSLENYVQEAGRAGRKESIQAECYILFNEDDLDKHFQLLSQTKLSIPEINQVWKAIKGLTNSRAKTSSSALEIARRAGWDDNIRDIEAKVTTAIAALEKAGYVKRGQNAPMVFATSILEKNADAAIQKIYQSSVIPPSEQEAAIRIIKKLFSTKSKRLSTDEKAEARVDYIADQLGLDKNRVIRIIEYLREEHILADQRDITAYIKRSDSQNRVASIIKNFQKIEDFLVDFLQEGKAEYNLKEINGSLSSRGVTSTISEIKTFLHFLGIREIIKFRYSDGSKNFVFMELQLAKKELKKRIERCRPLNLFISEYLVESAKKIAPNRSEAEVLVEFSIQELKDTASRRIDLAGEQYTAEDIESSLFFLSRISAIKIEGGFLVSYNRLQIDRTERNNAIQYKKSDYVDLENYYQQRTEQIHIVGEYAKKMMKDYEAALQFVDDYFKINYSSFINKYFNKEQKANINQPINPTTFARLFGSLNPSQLRIIYDKISSRIVVAAGPGSGKTKVLVHKLASLLLLEEVKNDQLLMLTFSRAAATEFKSRLLNLIGNVAQYVEIKTFHSYAFDLLGLVGDIENSKGIVAQASEKILSGEIEPNRITKTVLVIDEAQDIDINEYNLIQALSSINPDMRVILVGDDDQNIYGFRGSDSKFMAEFIDKAGATKYELVQNFRSGQRIVSFSNSWIAQVSGRLKLTPIQSVLKDEGVVYNIFFPNGVNTSSAVETVLKNELIGTTAILTRTNEEAEHIHALLVNRGRRSKLIQTNDGFSLANIYELRVFHAELLRDRSSPSISEDEWIDVRQFFRNRFSEVKHYKTLVEIINRFSIVNPNSKYISDWEMYLKESRLEDFVTVESDMIIVSTMHKAKGREFDNVFIQSGEHQYLSNEDKRLLYVGLTRAKSKLTISCSKDPFERINRELYDQLIDTTVYPKPEKLTLQLTLRDINLGSCERNERHVKLLSTGDTLQIGANDLCNQAGYQILRFSKTFQARLKLFEQQGYKVAEARVDRLLFWMNKDTGKEALVVLPELTLAGNNVV